MIRDTLPKISLYCTKDGSDKEYHAEIRQQDDGYIVQIRFGKRGNAKEPKAKPPVMTLEQATLAFEAIVKDKKSPKKEYTECEDGIGYASSELSGQMSGNKPQLLVAIAREFLDELVYDDRYGFQQKFDGQRLMVDRKGGTVITSNKLGVINSVSNNIVDDVLALPVDDILIDGESLDNQMYVFDILRLNGECLRDKSTAERHAILSRLDFGANLIVVEMMTGTDAKAAFLAKAQQKNHAAIVEGIVPKLLKAPYVSGRAAPTDATQYKYKFCEAASFVVASIETGKSSVYIGLMGADGFLKTYGKVGIPAKYGMPELGSVLDVQYRHLFASGGLCEPVFQKTRDDVRPGECTLAQVHRLKTTVSCSDDDLVD